jgi:hypothetical protein
MVSDWIRLDSHSIRSYCQCDCRRLGIDFRVRRHPARICLTPAELVDTSRLTKSNEEEQQQLFADGLVESFLVGWVLIWPWGWNRSAENPPNSEPIGDCAQAVPVGRRLRANITYFGHPGTPVSGKLVSQDRSGFSDQKGYSSLGQGAARFFNCV